MCSIRYSITLFITSFMAFAPSPAAAAVVTHIHWDVEGGLFTGSSLAHGPITGGAIGWTPPGGSINLTTTNAAGGGTWTVILTGPSGYFRLGGPSYPGGGVVSWSVGSPNSFQVAVLDAVEVHPNPGRFCRFITGTCFFSGLGGPGPTMKGFSHYFTLGREVRTVVPEPSTGTLLGLGLGFLGLGGGGGGIAARARRVRRR
jgi:hypothetical protein